MTRLRRLIVIALVLLFPLRMAAGVDVRVVPCAVLPDDPLRIEAVSLSTDEEQAGAVDLVLPPGRLSGRLELDEPRRWSLEVVAPDVWSQKHRLSPDDDEAAVIHVWPETNLTGRLGVPRHEKRPEEMVVRLQPVRLQPVASGPCRVDEIVSRCAVGGDGSFACKLPAGRWNVRLKAEGWAPRHDWDIALPAGGSLDLGLVSMLRGASLVGEVTASDGPAIPDATRVELTPIGEATSEAEAGERHRAHHRRTTINSQGFFVFEDVAPGSYEVRAHQPGYAEARLRLVEVAAGRDTRLVQPLVLWPPVQLVVEVRPADKAGDPWRVEIERTGEPAATARPIAGVVGEDGRWTSPDLVPGEYVVQVLDDRGNRVAWRESVLVEGGGEPHLLIDLDLVQVAGSVSIGGDPLEAELWFGGRNGTESVRAASDADGRFETYLPHPGSWTVDVFATRPPVASRGYPVDVDDEDDDLRIELPATEVAGEVVDASGSPVAGAAVRLVLTSSDPTLLSATADERGKFVLSGVREGSYWVEAESGERSSATVVAEVVEGRPPPYLRLVVEERRVYAGTVVAEHGAVAGAVVIAFPLASDGPPTMPGEAVSRADGSFAVSVATTTPEALLVVMPPGFALKLARVSGQAPVRVEVAPAAGAIRLPPLAQLAEGQVPLLLVGDEPVDPHLLRRWAGINGAPIDEAGSWRVPAMPAGAYAYCPLSLDEAVLVVTGRARPTRCSRGFLEAGGELTLGTP